MTKLAAAKYDFYVPTFQLKLDGRAQGKDVVRDVLQVTYRDSLKQVDTVELTINNWDAERRVFKYSDTKLFDPPKVLELWLGYYGKERLTLMLTGEITNMRPDFPAGGGSTLTVSAQNLLHSLRKQQQSHTYTDKTDSEIAREIANRLQVDIETKPKPGEPRYAHLFQRNQHDIVFLKERADKIGYDLFVTVKDGKSRLFFGASTNVKSKTYELVYGGGLIQFQPHLSTSRQVNSVTVNGWDRSNKQPITHTAHRSGISTQGVGTAGGQGDIDQAYSDRHEVLALPVESEAEARQVAEERLESSAKGLLTGNGSTIGLPDLRAGSVVHLTGLGKRFSGRYFVTSTTHTINDSGYTTRFACRREEL